MKQTCSIAVMGTEFTCFVCGEHVHDGYHHECESDGQEIKRKTWAIGTPRPHRWSKKRKSK